MIKTEWALCETVAANAADLWDLALCHGVVLTAYPAVQMRSKKDFVHEEDVRTGRQRGWMNVVEGLELHKNLLSPAEQDIFIQAIRDWEAAGRRVSHLLQCLSCAVSLVSLWESRKYEAH